MSILMKRSQTLHNKITYKRDTQNGSNMTHYILGLKRNSKGMAWDNYWEIYQLWYYTAAKSTFSFRSPIFSPSHTHSSYRTVGNVLQIWNSTLAFNTFQQHWKFRSYGIYSLLSFLWPSHPTYPHTNIAFQPQWSCSSLKRTEFSSALWPLHMAIFLPEILLFSLFDLWISVRMSFN